VLISTLELVELLNVNTGHHKHRNRGPEGSGPLTCFKAGIWPLTFVLIITPLTSKAIYDPTCSSFWFHWIIRRHN